MEAEERVAAGFMPAVRRSISFSISSLSNQEWEVRGRKVRDYLKDSNQLLTADSFALCDYCHPLKR